MTTSTNTTAPSFNSTSSYNYKGVEQVSQKMEAVRSFEMQKQPVLQELPPTNTIEAPAGAKYLSEFIPELPQNCLFDKGSVGCGGTTVALRDDKPTIIAVPFRALIANKMDTEPNLCGVRGGTDDWIIENYLSKDHIKVKKFMVTYDSLERLLKFVNPSDYHLVIDEYHLLFTQYSFRREAVQKVLRNYKKFASYTFMTATPLEREFVLDELKDLPISRVVWKNAKPVKVRSVKCKNVSYSTHDILEKYKSGKEEGNAYVFVNSVNFIKELVSSLNLKSSDYRAIVSENNPDAKGLSIATPACPPRKINFITSTAFEGVDFFDEKADIYIVSDASKAHTLTDISTSFMQIAGRIRDAKNRGSVTHLYSTTRYSDISYDEFKINCDNTIEKVHKFLTHLSNLPKYVVEKLSIEADTYVGKQDNVFTFDANLVKIDLFNYHICRGIYKAKSNLIKEYSSNNIEVTTDISEVERPATFKKGRVSFKDVCIEISEMDILDDRREMFYSKYPFLREALSVLGMEYIKSVDYNVTRVKAALLHRTDRSTQAKVSSLLKTYSELSNGNWVTSSRINEILNEVKEELGLNKTVKISSYYITKNKVRWDKAENKAVRGVNIIMPKVIIEG